LEKINDRLLNWASILEEKTRAQAVLTSTMPFIHPHLALMPDAHLGMGATVGSVIPTKGAIMPAAVGVDIGCGMMAIRTQWTQEDVLRRGRANLHFLREAIEQRIPLSAGNYNTSLWGRKTEGRVEYLTEKAESGRGVDLSRSPNWALQLGTLGSGNHFIEISYDEEDRVWLFLHSGSRGVGNKIAQRHIKIAQDLMAKYWITLPDKDLAYLVQGTDEFWAYIREMNWAQEFAYLNREEMMDRVIDAAQDWFGEDLVQDKQVNCHHNYTVRTKVFGQEVWLSRKGAIDASEGTLGLIPGSMGTRSYVVRGKGHPVALNSAPHGAGREYSRTAARNQFTMADLEAAMGDVEWRKTDAFVDEIPGAYKDIDVVMADAKDLVEVVHTLRQFVNVKGD
jgi:tRNA-splicing ligase RtcB